MSWTTLPKFRDMFSNGQYRRQADVLRDARSYEPAALAYESALCSDNNNAALHIQCGHMHKEAGNLSKAEFHYLTALRMLPNDADLRLQLGHFYKVAKRYQASAAEYFAAIQLHPAWPEAVAEYVATILDRNCTPPSPDLAGSLKATKLDFLFDPTFYAQQSGIKIDGLSHYRSEGWKSDLNPHPLFNTRYYVSMLGRPIVGDPLADFANRGMHELAEIHPLLDVRRYSRRSSDCDRTGLHPFVHYLWKSASEDVDGYRFFDPSFYRDRVPGLHEAGLAPLNHYLQFGFHTGLAPNRQVDPTLLSRMAELPEGSEPLTDMAAAIMLADNRRPAKRIDTSIIVLNLGKAMLTLQCLHVLTRKTDMSHVEIIILDNGSPADDFELLCRYARNCRIIRSDVNLGFGEANNVASEHASGEHLVFLNNDVFVTDGWLEPLLRAVAQEGVGVAGPMFVYPDGRLQEAGATVDPDGHVHQRGKDMYGLHPRYLVARNVDYVSAATLVMRADLFRTVMGFDLMWDPAYYEDVDLCLKVLLAGKTVRYEPASKVRHIENATSADTILNLRLNTAVATNRVKFVNRWAAYLESRQTQDGGQLMMPAHPPRPVRARRTLALFTPFLLTPGGGERYLLSFAHNLRDEYDCVLYTFQHTSALRLATMGRELGLDLDHVVCARWDDAHTRDRPDVFVSIGNEVIPFANAIGRKNYFICQFPFPLAPENYRRDWGKGKFYDRTIVYSNYVLTHYRQAYAEGNNDEPNVTIIAPPVSPIIGERRPAAGKATVLNVGRFNPGGHCKRQDVMIEAFRTLRAQTDIDVELHLAGSIGQDAASREYLVNLQEAAKGLPVYFHVNCSPAQLSDLFLRADVYWHATGINDRVAVHPERFEHFGITIVEAMSAGVIPVSLKFGGPGEIIRHGEDGFLIGTPAELVDVTAEIMAMDRHRLEEMRLKARARSKHFSPDAFKAAALDLFGEREKVLPPRKVEWLAMQEN